LRYSSNGLIAKLVLLLGGEEEGEKERDRNRRAVQVRRYACVVACMYGWEQATDTSLELGQT